VIESFKIIFILNSRRIRIYNRVTRTTLKTPSSILIVSIKNALKIVQRESVYAIFSKRIQSDFVRINTRTPCLFLLSRKKIIIITWKTSTRIKRIFIIITRLWHFSSRFISVRAFSTLCVVFTICACAERASSKNDNAFVHSSHASSSQYGIPSKTTWTFSGQKTFSMVDPFSTN